MTKETNIISNSVAPSQLDLELNDIGIFVGPQRSFRNNIDNEVDLTTVPVAKSDNSEDDRYGGTYMGSPKMPVKENMLVSRKDKSGNDEMI